MKKIKRGSKKFVAFLGSLLGLSLMSSCNYDKEPENECMYGPRTEITTLQGYIKDSDGKSLSSEDVKVYYYDETSRSEIPVTVTEDGWYTLTVSEDASSITLYIDSNNNTYEEVVEVKQGQNTKDITVDSNTIIPIEISLEGYIKDHDGNPLNSSDIIVFYYDESSESNVRVNLSDDGYYFLKLPMGIPSITLCIESKRYYFLSHEETITIKNSQNTKDIIVDTNETICMYGPAIDMD